MFEERVYTAAELLKSQKTGCFGAGVTARIHVKVDGEQGKGRPFESLVRQFQQQGLPVVSAIHASDIPDAGRVIHAPGDIILGELNRGQIESLQHQGYALRPHSSPGP